jgi:hypothetical protein
VAKGTLSDSISGVQPPGGGTATHGAATSATAKTVTITPSFQSAPDETPEVRQQREAELRLVELFRYEQRDGRYPTGPKDGEAWWALVRERERNLLHQMKAPPLPVEPDRGRWRRRSAKRALGRIYRAEADRISRVKADRINRVEVAPRADNGREPRGRTARRVAAARDGPPRSSDDDPHDYVAALLRREAVS